MTQELAPELIRRVLIATEFDYTEDLFWRHHEDGALVLYARCDDFFMWGCSDVEEIETQADVELLEKSLADLRETSGDRWPRWPTYLYAARRRNQQPASFMLAEGSEYRIADNIRHLFIDGLAPNRVDEVIKKKAD